MMLVDGVTVLEANEFVSGQEVYIVSEEEKIPLPIGEYELEDGKILVVSEDGIIGEIKDAVEEEEAVAVFSLSERAKAPQSEWRIASLSFGTLPWRLGPRMLRRLQMCLCTLRARAQRHQQHSLESSISRERKPMEPAARWTCGVASPRKARNCSALPGRLLAPERPGAEETVWKSSMGAE